MNGFHTKSFIGKLNDVAKRQLQSQETTNNRSLANRIAEWWHCLPDSQRKLEYSMDQLTGLFDTCPQVLGPTLLTLGWVRRRSWAAGESYRRYWVPPGM